MAHTETVLRKCPHTGTLVLAQVTVPDEEYIVCLHSDSLTQDMNEVIEWLHNTDVAQKIIEKAREWLSDNKDNYIIDIEGETLVDDQLITDFCKIMEE